MSQDFDEYDDDDDTGDEPVADMRQLRALRKELREAKKDSKRARELEQELFAYKSQNVLSEAELTSLSDRARKALVNDPDFVADPTVSTARRIAAEYGWASKEDHAADAAEAAQRAIVEAAQGAKNAAPPAQVTPAEFGAWDMPRRKDFYQRHPEKFAALERGETVRMT